MIKRHILVVDDDEQTLTLIQFMLEQAGYIVKTQKDGYGAIDQIKRFPFDLILLDIGMPFADGFSVSKTIKGIEQAKDIPIIFITGRNDVRSVQKAVTSGAKDFIIKPPEREDLLNRIERVLGSKPQFQEIKPEKAGLPFGGTLHYNVKVLSISVTGLVVELPIPVEVGTNIKNLEIDILTELGFQKPNLKVCSCQEIENKYQAFCSFIEMSDKEIQIIRDWIISESYK